MGGVRTIFSPSCGKTFIKSSRSMSSVRYCAHESRRCQSPLTTREATLCWAGLAHLDVERREAGVGDALLGGGVERGALQRPLLLPRLIRILKTTRSVRPESPIHVPRNLTEVEKATPVASRARREAERTLCLPQVPMVLRNDAYSSAFSAPSLSLSQSRKIAWIMFCGSMNSLRSQPPTSNHHGQR